MIYLFKLIEMNKEITETEDCLELFVAQAQKEGPGRIKQIIVDREVHNFTRALLLVCNSDLHRVDQILRMAEDAMWEGFAPTDLEPFVGEKMLQSFLEDRGFEVNRYIRLLKEGSQELLITTPNGEDSTVSLESVTYDQRCYEFYDFLRFCEEEYGFAED